MQGTRRIFFQNARNLANLHRHCELGKKGLKCPWRPSWPSRRPRPSSRPFLTTDDLFWCPRHVLDVHGSLHGLFWRPTDFFDTDTSSSPYFSWICSVDISLYFAGLHLTYVIFKCPYINHSSILYLQLQGCFDNWQTWRNVSWVTCSHNTFY